MLGILCGLKQESNIAGRVSGAIVSCSAAKPNQALALARTMASKPISRLISFGLAAGLSPDLREGDLVLGSSVMTAHHAWEADQAWNARFIQMFPSALCVPVWGSSKLLSTAAYKEKVYKRSGCFVADMESQAVALAAQERGLPFTVVRALSDSFDVDLPPAARMPLKEDGGVLFSSVLKSIYKEPTQCFDLIRLGASVSMALKSLKTSIEPINYASSK